jgi:hypothetical protein
MDDHGLEQPLTLGVGRARTVRLLYFAAVQQPPPTL